MNDREHMRRKKIWDALTEVEKDAVEQKRAAILQWSVEAEKTAFEKIKAEGRYTGGLDGHYPELQEISKETTRKISELLNSIFDNDTTSQ